MPESDCERGWKGASPSLFLFALRWPHTPHGQNHQCFYRHLSWLSIHPSCSRAAGCTADRRVPRRESRSERVATPLGGRCCGARRSNDVGILGRACRRLTTLAAGVRRALHACLWARLQVGTHAAGTRTDLLRSRAQLLAENALLRKQLLVGLARNPSVAVTRDADGATRTQDLEGVSLRAPALLHSPRQVHGRAKTSDLVHCQAN